MLETTDLRVGNIGSYLGYKDQFYFSRIFKKTVGVSPQRYRNQTINQVANTLL